MTFGMKKHIAHKGKYVLQKILGGVSRRKIKGVLRKNAVGEEAQISNKIQEKQETERDEREGAVYSLEHEGQFWN